MLVGVPKEIKNLEFRVGLTPASVHELVAHGHSVVVESTAGIGISATDREYRKVGATIAKDAKSVYAKADMIVKVKEPQPHECKMLGRGQTLFTYLHLVADKKSTELLLRSGGDCIAYETVTDESGGLPLLTPMSRIAGRLAAQAGANCLHKPLGGSGKLLSGGGGVPPARVLVIGGGVVGQNAAKIASGMGAQVVVLDRSLLILDQIEREMPGIIAMHSNVATITEQVALADVVIGAVLIPGASAPKLVTRKMLRTMQPGSAIVDVAIDQGGCTATSRVTTHQDPVYLVDKVVHYCVGNMPGAVPHTATHGLNNATLPYVVQLANGVSAALRSNRHLRNGLSIYDGKLTCKAAAKSLKIAWHDPEKILH